MTLRRTPRCTTSIAATSLAAVGLVLALAAPARAEPGDASAQFATGMRLMSEAVNEHDRGKLALACEALAASNRLDSTAGTLIQLADCRARNQQLASAWAAYREALARAKSPRKQQLAADGARALEPRLSTLTIAVASRADGLVITLDGAAVDPATWNQAQPIDGGAHVIAGRAPGRVDWQTTAQIAVERDASRVEVPALAVIAPVAPEPVIAPAEVARTIAPPPVIITPPPPPQARWLTGRREVALGIAGAGVASAVIGAIVGASANGQKDSALALCPGGKPGVTTACVQADHANALIHSAHDRALAANLLFGAAGASAVAAGLLWFTGGPSAESPHQLGVAPSVAPGATSLVIAGRF